MQRWFFITGVIVIIAIGGFIVFNKYIYDQKQQSLPITQYRGTLTGEYVCLPYKNNSEIQIVECAVGMKTEGNEYYAIDFNLTSQEKPDLKTGDRFTATGTITPIEMLNTDYWEKNYSVKGIFSVTDSVTKLPI